MMRNEPTEVVAARLAVTLVCWPETMVTDWRQGGAPTTRTSTM